MGNVQDIDHGWNKVRAELAKAKGAFVKVGVLQDAGAEEDGTSLVSIATWNHFGTPSIPSRPFLTQAFDKALGELNSMLKARTDRILSGKETAKFALDKVGVWFTGKVKLIFTQGSFKANRPYTIWKKKSSRPLIDSGRLRASINHKVEGA